MLDQLYLLLGLKSPLDSANDATEVHKRIAKSCCQYDDGSGEVNERALAATFRGFKADRLRPAIENTGLAANLKLLKTLRTISDRVKRVPVGLSELEKVVIAAIRLHLPRVDTIAEVHDTVCGICCEYSDGSGDPYLGSTQQLFADFPLQEVEPMLASAKLKDLQRFDDMLSVLGKGLSTTRPAGIDALRVAIDRHLTPRLEQACQSFRKASDPLTLKTLFTDSCTGYDDGSGNAYRSGFEKLFAEVDTQEVFRRIARAPAESILALSKTLLQTRSRTDEWKLAGLERFRVAVAGAAGVASNKAGMDTFLNLLICNCFRYDDFSGEVFVPQAQAFFGQLTAMPAAAQTSTASPTAVMKLNQALEILGGKLQGKPSENLAAVRTQMGQTARRTVKQVVAAAHAAGTPEQLGKTIASIGSHYDDGSGNAYPVPLQLFFEEFSVTTVQPLLKSAALEALVDLSIVLRRIVMGLERTNDRSSGLEQLLVAVAGASGGQWGSARDAEAAVKAVFANCCRYDDGSGEIYGNQVRSFFNAVVAVPGAGKNWNLASRNRLLDALNLIASRHTERMDGLEQLIEAVQSGANSYGENQPVQQGALPYLQRLQQIALDRSEGVYVLRTPGTTWANLSAEILGKGLDGDAQPQLCLRLQTHDMAQAVCALRSEASDRLVAATPVITTLSDGGSSVQFQLAHYAEVAELLRALLKSDFGPTQPRIINGAVCGLPADEHHRFVQTFSLPSALTMGAAFSW